MSTKTDNKNTVNIPSLVSQIRAAIASTAAIQSKWIKSISVRASKLTEMDIRSPSFSVKATLFLTLIDIAAKTVSSSTEGDSLIEPSALRKAVSSLCSCVEEHGGSTTATPIKSTTSTSAANRRSRDASYCTIVSQLVCRVLAVLKTLDAAQLFLAKLPTSSTSITDPTLLFPNSNTRSMKSSRACHDAFDFLLVLAGRPSSRGCSIVKRGKKHRTKKKKKTDHRAEEKNQKNPSAPTSPMGYSSPLVSPRGASSPIAVPSDFDYFGGASISTARMPLHPEKNKAMVRKSNSNRTNGSSDESNQIERLQHKIAGLESKLQDTRGLNECLMLQSKLIEESPESAALVLDARRLMMVESKNYQLERQRDVLLAALEGQQQVVDHSERILLELSSMAATSKFGKMNCSNHGSTSETFHERILNLLERLKASARSSARSRTFNLEEQ